MSHGVIAGLSPPTKAPTRASGDWSAGKFYGQRRQKDRGIKTTQPGRPSSTRHQRTILTKPLLKPGQTAGYSISGETRAKHRLRRALRESFLAATSIRRTSTATRPKNHVLIDNERAEGGELVEADDWTSCHPRRSKDPAAKKPDDWDEREKIDDTERQEARRDWDKPKTIRRSPRPRSRTSWDERDGR
uniref:Mago-bind domain-containing protein n=1 Tax=Macrostomum lignano TaxID=282301 RepID=A0A1I8FPF8_9PLAT